MSNANDLSVLSASGRILRKLQLYYLINGDRAYDANQIAFELGIDTSIMPAAVTILQRSSLVSLEEDKIRLTDLAVDASAIRPEELMWRPRFQSLIEAAMRCLNPEKGGAVFDRSVFIIMAYDEVTNPLRKPIRDVCQKFGLTARFADDHIYDPQIWDNVMCYALCSKYGIALFHKNENSHKKKRKSWFFHEKSSNLSVSYNLNVALEVGAMLAWGRLCCFLKDKSLPHLQADIIGWIYRECDFNDPKSVVDKIESFFCEKGLKKDPNMGRPSTT